jgi:tRNA-guanine family transglycosylase
VIRPTHLKLPGHDKVALPMVWLGQSVRTTVVTRRYTEFARESWMVSLGDAVHRPSLVEKVFKANIRARIAVQGPLMLDSGGFTTMMNNRSLRLDQIVEIYRDAQAELCITLDIPPIESDSSRERCSKYRKSRNNLAAIVDAIDPRRVVPVVHGATIQEIEKNCLAISALLRRPRMICLGGLVPLLRGSMQRTADRGRSIAWLNMLICTVRREFPKSVIHILGAGSPQNVATAIACGADSTDSLAWRRAAGFGTVYLPGTSERFLAPRNRQRESSRRTISRKELQLLEACGCPACREWPGLADRIAGLSNSYLARAAHNAFVVLSQAKALKFRYDDRYQGRLRAGDAGGLAQAIDAQLARATSTATSY